MQREGEGGRKKKRKNTNSILHTTGKVAEDRQHRAACRPALPGGCRAQVLPRGRALSSPGSFSIGFGGILFRKQVVGEGRPSLSWRPSCSCCRQTCWPGISGGWSCLGCAARSRSVGRGREGEAGGYHGGTGAAVSGVPTLACSAGQCWCASGSSAAGTAVPTGWLQPADPGRCRLWLLGAC